MNDEPLAIQVQHAFHRPQRHSACVPNRSTKLVSESGAETPRACQGSAGDYFYSGGSKTWDVAPDGPFLMKKALRAEYSINVVLNWQEELKRLVPLK